MNLDAIPIGKNPPDDLNVITEVGIGGEPIKYEMNKEAGALFVDRFLHTPMRAGTSPAMTVFFGSNRNNSKPQRR